jgi:two-component system, cell cycle sensor histidine kinase and response regulator CckA
VLPRPVACLLILGWTASPAAADWLGAWGPPPLGFAQQVRSLSREVAGAARPVKLTGVITHINPHLDDFFLQDESAGIYVHPTLLAAGLHFGERIELEGETNSGDFSPCVIAKKITSLGQGKLPDPLPFDMAPEDSRWMDGQWVQAYVVVRGIRKDPLATRLDVYTSKGAGVVVIPGAQRAVAAKSLKDVAVTVRGVCVPTFADRMISGLPKIYMMDLPQASFSPPESEREPEAPPRMIDHLLSFSPAPHPGNRRAKIAGVVTATPFPGVIIIQDETGGATVWTSPPRTDIPIGVRVEAFGLLRIDGRRISLTQAKVTILGAAPLPPALPITATDLASGLRNSLLVHLDARVEAIGVLAGWTVVVLVEGVTRFEAYIPGLPEQNRFDRLEPGSRVAVAGVAMEVSPDGRAGVGPSLFLPTSDSVTLLEPPPQPPTFPEPTWWSATRVAYLSGGFMAVTLFGSGWLITLRHQVRRAAEEVKRHYEEKAKLERQLRQAAKLEAVGRLAGGIAHDFNNLLTVINGCAELLTDEAGLENGRVSVLAEDIRRAGERAAALTGQLLTFSRKREVLISAVDLNEVVTDTVRLLDRVIGENILIQTNFASDLPRICGEPGLLHQVVMNLAVNAKDAMPGGGTLTLTTAQVAEPVIAPAHHNIGAGVSFRHFVRLTVSDTGTGMTDEVKARIFEPFFTTKEVGTGTGLGLATVYGIIQTVRGKIRVDSTIGRGTTFHMDLRIHGEPISDAELTLPGATPLPTRRVLGTAKLRGTTIMVVEDNAMVRDLLVTGLTTDGATVLAAENPNQALRVLADYPSRVDVMVTDVVMPGMNGRILAERVQVERPTVQVVFMSGYTADEVLREGVLADQVEFLQKPFTPDHLTNRLLGILEQRTKS